MSVERLAFGTLAVGNQTVYTVPRQTRVVITSLLLSNVGSTSVEVSARVGASGAWYPAIPESMVLGAGDAYHLSTPIAIEAGESLQLASSVASGVLFYFSGEKSGAIPSPSTRGT